MAKAAAATTATKKPDHPSYKDMITEAITVLKERKGSSRQAIKKFVQANHNITASNFDTQFNLALRRGVEKGDFVQPKGPSGPVKLQKKEPVKKTEKKVKKPAAKKATATKAAPKKAAPKKAASSPTAAKKVTKPAAKKVTKPAAKKATATKKAAPKKAVAKATTKKTKKESK